MHKRDIVNDLSVAQLLIPAVRTADASSTGLDREGYQNAALLIAIGNSGDTLSGSVYATVIIEHSDALGSGYAAVAAADVVIPENAPTGVAAPDGTGIVYTFDAPAEDSLDILVGYVGSKQFVRARIDVTGTHTNGFPCAVHGILGMPQFAPAGS